MSGTEPEPVVAEEPVAPKEKKSRKKAVAIAKPEVDSVNPRRGKKMSETEKKSLSDHMASFAAKQGTPTEVRSHRMKVMSRMRKGMSIEDALKDIA